MDIELFGNRCMYQGKPASIGVLLDIKDRKRAEEELAKKTAGLVRSNQDLEHFAYIASHDLQEHLRMISSFTELLAKRYKGRLDSDADEFINFVVDGAVRLKQLINDLLGYSRVGTHDQPLSPTNLAAVFDRVTRNLSAAIEESGAVVKSSDLPTVMGDEVQLT